MLPPFLNPYGTDRPTQRVPYATYGLLAANLFVFLGMISLANTGSLQAAFTHKFGFIPAQGHWYSVFTSMFVHASPTHLLSNMLLLWLFGVLVEDALGPLVFLVFYLGSQLGANLLHLVITREVIAAANTPLVGASGAVAGLLGLVAVRFYRTKVKVFYWLLVRFGVFQISALVFVGVWLAWELYQGLVWVGYETLGTGLHSDPVAHWAHIGGFCFGALGAAALNLRHEGRQEYLLAQLRQNPLAFSGYDVASELEILAGDRPRDPEVHHALARQYMLSHRPPAAGQAFMKATTLYLRNGNLEAGAGTYTELLACFPDCVLPLADQLGVACALEQIGKYGLALQAFDKLCHSYPDTPEAQTALVRAGQLCSNRLGNTRLALRFFSSLLEQYPDTEWRSFAEQQIVKLGGRPPSRPQ